MIWFTLAWVVALLYALLQLQYLVFWKTIKTVLVPSDASPPSRGVSIIVVVRNEATTIADCLRGLLHQSYPRDLIQIMVIDDESTDGTTDQIRQQNDPRVQCLRLQDYPDYIQAPAYKKSAVTLGIDHARHDVIVVTDADCLHPTDWLKTMVYAFDAQQASFQTGPVLLLPEKNLLSAMQAAEMLTFMLITGSGIRSGLHDIANGANMAFSKKAFLEVGGFEGNYHYASGDDMFLIEKIRKAYPDKIHFVKSREAVVFTPAKSTWSTLLQQRVRWAGKNKGLQRQSIWWIWTFVGSYHVLLGLFFTAALFHVLSWFPFLLLLTLKWVSDYFVLYQSALFFRRTSLLRLFIPLQGLYFWYIGRLGLALMSHRKGDWENRT